MALGLAGCGPAVDVETSGGETESQGSAEGPMTDPTVTPTTISTSGPSGSGPTTTPPDPTFPSTSGCLSPPLETSSSSGIDDSNFIEPETSACLSPPDTWTTTGTGTESDSFTTTGTSTGASSDSTTSAGADNDRGRILERLNDSGVLPRDLLDRLKRGPG